MISDQNTFLFLQSLRLPFSDSLEQVYSDALDRGVPVISRDIAELIVTLITIKQPLNILEIGSAVAFSASLMATHMPHSGRVITIERNPDMISIAKQNIRSLGFDDKIHLLEGDASHILPSLNSSFDLIFMDAAKAQYINFLPECLRLLNSDGIIIADNVLQHGAIAMDISQIPRRNRTIYNRLRQFLHDMYSLQDFKTTILPIGDGVLISSHSSKGVV